MIEAGHKEWAMQDAMTCNHAKHGNKVKHPDPVGMPLGYMVSHKVFKPLKADVYALCHFYQLGENGDPPPLPVPHKPATRVQVCDLLKTACQHGQPNILMAHTQDSVTAVCLLHELHEVASLQHLAMEMVAEGGKEKVLFCPFCQYVGSNDMSYLNHIVIAHYDTSYGFGKCLKLAFKSRQQLKVHKKVCKGFKKKAADKLAEKPASSGMNAINPSYSTLKKKPTTTSTLPDSQMSSQMLPSSQTSSRISHTTVLTTRRKPWWQLWRSRAHLTKTPRRSVTSVTSTRARTRRRCTSPNTTRTRSNVTHASTIISSVIRS